MRYLPMRRSKLTSSEGPGSLVINPDGETLLVGALDHWFQQPDENGLPKLDPEFLVKEPRISGFLNVDALYQPPDYRQPTRQTERLLANMNLVIPLYRFPTWHYCSKCYTLKKFKLDATSTYVECETCGKLRRHFKQVPFITICDEGHINEFPWIAWVHRNERTTCKKTLTLKMSGGTTLDTWLVVCGCGEQRSLKGITGVMNETNETSLGKILNRNPTAIYMCPGNRPWCGTLEEEQEVGSCSELPLAILRNSINVYMPKKVSAIYIPEDLSETEQQIVELIKEKEEIQQLIEEFKNETEILLRMLKSTLKQSGIEQIEDEVYINALAYYNGENNAVIEEVSNIKHEEFEALKTDKLFHKKDLVIEPVWKNQSTEHDKTNVYKRYLQRISKVSRLKETTVLYGFDRRRVKTKDSYAAYIEMLYKNKSIHEKVWLPASITYGEGIFIEFNKDMLQQWEQKEAVQQYFNHYVKRVENESHRDENIVALPRNIMIHTMAHFLIEQFGEISGYMAASIRERLYLEQHQGGILIYTASGDSEGTYGGLVKLANEEEFFRCFDLAIMKAHWCSSDPVCTELGKEYGQGINALNGAACHNCTHVPETSCEFVNRYLDRTFLIDPEIGFFNFLALLKVDVEN